MFIFVRTLPWNNLWGNRLWFGRRYRSFIGTSHLHQGGTLVAFEFQSDAFFFSWWKSVLFLWLTFCIKTVHVFFFGWILVLQENICFSHQIEVCHDKKCAKNKLCWWHRTIVFCLKSKHWIWEVLWQKVCNMGVDMVKTIQEVLKS